MVITSDTGLGMGGGVGKGLILFHHLIFFYKKLFCFTLNHLPPPSNTHTLTHSHTQVLNFVFNGNILVGTAMMD